MKRLLFLLAALLLAAGCRTTVPELQRRAAGGDVGAGRKLGMLFFYGGRENRQLDYAAAREHFALAALGGDPVSLYHAGLFYDLGLGGVEPRSELAADFYRRALPGIRALAPDDPDASFVLGEMLYHGRGVEADRAAALAHYRRARRRQSLTGLLRMGELYATGLNTLPPPPQVIQGADGSRIVQRIPAEQLLGRDLSQSAYLLESAANLGSPAADYGLYLQSGRRALLTRAAAANYPPAVFEAASGDPAAVRAAAEAGHAPALHALANQTNDPAERRTLLYRAARRDFAPAIFDLAQECCRRCEYGMAQALLGLPALEQDPRRETALEELDEASGTVAALSPVTSLVRRGAELEKLDSDFALYVRAERAGIDNVREIYRRHLTSEGAATAAYWSGDAFRVAAEGLPMVYAGEIFKAYPGERDGRFFFNYALAAGLAGQGACQLGVTGKFAAFDPDGKLAALLKANALMLLNYPDEAYEVLFARGPLQSAAEKNIFRNFCVPLLRDRAKAAAATGFKEEELGEYREIAAQDFYDLQRGAFLTELPAGPEPELNLDALTEPEL